MDFASARMLKVNAPTHDPSVRRALMWLRIHPSETVLSEAALAFFSRSPVRIKRFPRVSHGCASGAYEEPLQDTLGVLSNGKKF